MGPIDYTAYESVTVSSASKSLTSGTYGTRRRALITAETATVRFRLDAVAPTSAVGHLLAPGDVLTLDSAEQVSKARFIRRDGTDATLRCSYGD